MSVRPGKGIHRPPHWYVPPIHSVLVGNQTSCWSGEDSKTILQQADKSLEPCLLHCDAKTAKFFDPNSRV